MSRSFGVVRKAISVSGAIHQYFPAVPSCMHAYVRAYISLAKARALPSDDDNSTALHFVLTYDDDGEPLPDSKPITTEIPQLRELRGVSL